MSDEIIVRFCAPTLAGIKPASLFTYIYDEAEDIIDSLRRVNRRLTGKGLRLIPLKLNIDMKRKCSRKKCLLYLYRPEQLSAALRGQDCLEILHEEGYRDAGCARYLSVLREHFSSQEEFPHEIGLFLGYPAEDVRGFIDNKGSNYKTCGYWKVYGDAECAEKKFCQYRKCTDIYCRRLEQGTAMEELAVAGKLKNVM